MKTLINVWGRQKGYVCISTLHRSTRAWKDHLFKWPQEHKKIAATIQEYKEDYEVYWAPAVFSQPRRKSENVESIRCLWADLDGVPPSKCPDKPSIAWESSPGRYQAIWFLTSPIQADAGEELNKRMTYYTGADKSGWDLPQVLRVPGTTNFKYVEKPTVKLLWAKKIFYDPIDLDNSLPDLSPVVTDISALTDDTSELRELIWPYRSFLGERLWSLLFAPDSIAEEPGERSDRLWELEHRLVEANVPVADIIRIVKACPWNKYRGRADEDKRILTEVLKVEKQVRENPVVAGVSRDLHVVSYADMLGKQIPSPGWLIENIWPNCSQGLIAGEPKTYKSIISTEMAVCVASGQPLWGQYPTRRTGPVLMVQEENADWIIQDRLRKIAAARGLLDGQVYNMGKDIVVEWPRQLPIFMVNGFGFDLTSMEHRESLERTIESIQPVLLILDPLYLMLGNLDENSAQEVRGTLQWLLEIKNKYRMSVVVVHHWNKGGKSERGGQRTLGSTTFHAWTEAGIYAKVTDVKRNIIGMEREFRAFAKPPDVQFQIEMSNPGDIPFYRTTIFEGNTKVVTSKDNLPSILLANQVITKKELEKISGMDKTTLWRALKTYEDKGYIIYSRDSSDKRVMLVSVTDDGREQLLKEVAG